MRDVVHALGGARAVLLPRVASHVALVDVLAAHHARDLLVPLLGDPLAGRADGARVPVRHVDDVVLGVILLLPSLR